VYVVPRQNGEVVVGATVEERGFDTTVTAGAVHELLREGYRVLPELAELELVDISAGLRPGSPDNGPLVGEWEDGVLVATGHYRNGILLAPVTAEATTAFLTGAEPPAEAVPFAPDRFVRV
jgi:glycine oxidase